MRLYPRSMSEHAPPRTLPQAVTDLLTEAAEYEDAAERLEGEALSLECQESWPAELVWTNTRTVFDKRRQAAEMRRRAAELRARVLS